MTKKKKRDEELEPSEFVIQLEGILLFIIAVIGLCPFGIVAKIIKGFSCFLFGSLWAVFLLYIGIIGVYTMIKRKYPKLFNGKTIGIIIVLIGILSILHVRYITDDIDPNKFKFLDDGMNICKTTVDNVFKYLNAALGIVTH